MKLKTVKLFNYKSFGEENNLLFVDDLNVVIGKNESGKSNLITGLSLINIKGKTDSEFFYSKNRNNNKDVSASFSFITEETDMYFSGYKNEISMNLYNGHCLINEEFGKFILNLDSVRDDYEQLVYLLQNESFSFSQTINVKNFQTINDMLNNIENELFILPKECMEFIKRMKDSSDARCKKLGELIENLEMSLFNVYLDFPVFIFLSDMSLKSSYNLSECNAEYEKDSDSILCQLLEVLGIDREEFRMVLASNDPVIIKNKEDEYNAILKEKFVREFNVFYSQEVMDMKFFFNSNNLNILIKTKGVYLEYKERSMGLKWYINMFIQLLYQSDKKIYNNIVLMDEPGIYLHFIAQKELIQFFSQLSQKRNQIIYTTHSPAMLDLDAMQNIRAIEKSENGYSYIYNKISEFPRESKSKNEIITPLVNALGYNISFNVGPSYQKLNIITEGITDYLYLNAYFKQKNISDYNVIASTGVNNIPAIASILYGWGCKFVILLDQDDQGRGVYDSIRDTKQPYLNVTFFVDLLEYNKGVIFETENLFSDEDRIKFELNASDYDDNKYFYAYKCYNSIHNGTNLMSDETILSFDKLIQMIATSNVE